MITEFAADVRSGLAKPQKELLSKYLYDELGSALFDAITVLPEYGLTRADERILRLHSGEIPREFSLVAELGSGSGRKTRAVLEPLGGPDYFPIDVSVPALDRCGRELADLARVTPVAATYLEGLDQVQKHRNGGHVLLLFLGSTIGNFEPRCRTELLKQVRSRLHPRDALLIGCDLVKPVEVMLEAYDDPSGVTASFNLNLLGRINRELGADFNLRAFAHEARYDASCRRIEMHLRARSDQSVTVREAGFQCSIRCGETIWTESSHKFELEEIEQMAIDAGFRPEAQWVDPEWPFAESLWRAA